VDRNIPSHRQGPARQRPEPHRPAVIGKAEADGAETFGRGVEVFPDGGPRIGAAIASMG